MIHGMSQLNSATRQPVHGLSCVNTWPTIHVGDQKRPPLQHVAKVFDGDFGDCYVHGIDRGDAGQYMAMLKFDAADESGLVCDLDGTVIPVYDRDGAGTYTLSVFPYLATSSAYSPSGFIRALTVQDYTFVVNRNRAVILDTATTSANTVGLAHIFIRQGLYGVKYKVKIKIGATTYTVYANTHDTPGEGFAAASSVEGQVVWDYARSSPAPSTAGTHTSYRISLKTEDIAELLKEKLNGVSGASYGSGIVAAGVLTATRVGSVVSVQIQAPATDYAEFEVSTSQGDNLAYGYHNTATLSSQLPLFYTHGYVLHVKGNSSGTEDDYYLKFVTDLGSGFGPGHWEESRKTGITYKWKTTSASQPHALLPRTDDGLGTVTGTPSAPFFSFEPLVLDERIVGDTESNPDPSFVSTVGDVGAGGPGAAFAIPRYVNDAVYFRDRLCFLSGENIACSETAEYMNFFRTSVRAVVDSDPVDVALTPDTVSSLHSGVQNAGKLILFSTDAQHQFLGSPNLTPASAEASEVSRYRSDPGVRPVAYEDGIVYAQLRGSYSGLGFLVPSDQAESAYRSLDLSLHVPSLIPGRIRQIAVTTSNSAIAALSSGDTSAIYLLKQHREGTQTLQSAWVKFTLEDAQIRGIHFFGEKLYVLSQRAEGVFLEYLDLSPGVLDGTRDHWIYLDRRVHSDDVISTVPGATTTITLPYEVEAGSVIELVREDTLARLVCTSSTGSAVVTAPANLTGVDYLIGRQYTSTHALHKPEIAYASEDGRRLILDSTSAVVALILRYENSSYFKVVSGSKTKEVGSSTTHSPASGKVLTGIGGRLDTPFAVSIQNDSPYPHAIAAGEWIVNATVRSQSLGR